MNQHCYRLVFNAHRRMLMAVAEITPQQGANASPARARPVVGRLSAALRPLVACLLLAHGAVWTLPAAAQIVADPAAPGKQRPTVLTTSSGAVQVNIQTPSAAGVSLNQYRQFDTGDAGTILNNSRVNVQTQSAGWVAANPWLATGSARVIVNQVNSQHPSLLRGTLEVAGQRAEVIIANPAGLQVSGATFLNASRTVLTSGTPVINGGNLDGYRVSGGEVSIGGNGLDTSASDYTAILARSVAANAGIWAQQLQVGTGSQAYAADGSGQGALAASGPAPAFALDVAALGGMYAGKIVLVGTEHGLGVRNAGKLVAGAGGLRLQADGQLLNSGTLGATDAAADVQLQTGAVSNDGTLSSARNLQLDSSGRLSNQGTLSAARQLTLNAAQLDNASNGTIDAQRLAITTATLSNSGQLRQSGSQALAVQAGQLQNSGSIGALPAQAPPGSGASAGAGSGNAEATVVQPLPLPEVAPAAGSSVQAAAPEVLPAGSIQVSGLLDNRGRILANGGIDLASQGGLVNHGTLVLGQLQVGGERFDNSQGSLRAQAVNIDTLSIGNQQGKLQVQGDAVLHSQAFDNWDGQIGAGGSLQLRSSQLDNQHGSVVAGQTLTVQGEALDNRAGTLASVGELQLQAGSVDNRGGRLQGEAGLRVQADGVLDNREHGLLSAAASLAVQAASVLNQQGEMAAARVQAQSLGGWQNAEGKLLSQQSLYLQAVNLDNQAGQILAGQDGSVMASGTIRNQAGRLQAAQRLQLQAEEVQNGGGLLAGQALQLESGSGGLDNRGGRVLAGRQGGQLAGSGLNNAAGVIYSDGALQIDTRGQLLDNSASGQLQSQAALQLDTGLLDNRQAQLLAAGPLNVHASALDNRGGQVQSAADITVQLAAALHNEDGLLRSNAGLHVQADQLYNQQTRQNDRGIEAASIQLQTPHLFNQQGALRGDYLTLRLGQLANQQGELSARQQLSLSPDDGAELHIDNDGGTLQAGDRLRLQATGLQGQGRLLSAGELNLQLAGDFQHDGQLQAGTDARLSIHGRLSNAGSLQAGRQLRIEAAALDNRNGASVAADETRLDITGQLDNRGLIDGRLTRITAGVLANDSTGRIYGDRLVIQARTVQNTGDGHAAPVIAARQQLDIAAGQISNQEQALIFSGGDMVLGGALDAAERATGQAGSLDNASARIETLGQLTLAVETLQNRDTHLQYQYQPGPVARTVTHYLNGVALDSAGLLLAKWEGDGIAYVSPEQTDWLGDDDYRKLLILSPRYPLSRFAAYYQHFPAPSQDYSYTKCRKDENCTTTQVGGAWYGNSDPIWATFGVLPPPGEPPLSADNPGRRYAGISLGQTSYSVTIDPPPEKGSAIRTLYFDHPVTQQELHEWQRWSAWHDNEYVPAHARLDAAIGEFAPLISTNAAPVRMLDAGAQWVDNWRYRDSTSSTQTPVVSATQPGEIVAGGDLSITLGRSGSNHSRILAGQNLVVTGGKLENIALQEDAITDIQGVDVYTHIESRRFKGDVRRNDSSPFANTERHAVVLQQGISQAHQAWQDGHAAPSALSLLSAPSGDAMAAPGHVSVTGQQTLPGVTELALPASVNGALDVIRTGGLSLTLPRSRLYLQQPERSAKVLIQTDPRFTQYGQWLSSDYMLSQLASDPAASQKRLGDGFYEQKLIRDQVAQLTGRRFLDGYASDEAQYRALMDSGLTFARQYGLRPGVALSAEQMAHLSSDIVWLVSETLTLPDGSQQSVLTPRLYVRTTPGDLQADGALLSGDRINLTLAGDLNNSGSIAGRRLVDIKAANFSQQGGQLSAADIQVQASHNLHNLGGQISASNSLQLHAGNDLTLASTTRQADGVNDQRTYLDRIASLYLSGGNGLLLASAGGNLTLQGATIVNQAAAGQTLLQAGKDLQLATLTTQSSHQAQWVPGNVLQESQQQDSGSQISSQGSLYLQAGGDVHATAANLSSAQGHLGLQAGGNIQLDSGQSRTQLDETHHNSQKGLLSSRSTTTRDTLDQTQAIGSQLSGQTVSVSAGKDLTVTGSSIASDLATTLNAGGNVTLVAAQNSSSESHSRDEKKSGLMSSGGLGFTIGKAAQGNANTVTTTQAVGSTLGSVQGDVVIQAGQAYRQTGSSILTPQGDIDVQAQSITIEEARQQTRVDSSSYSKQSGLTVGLGGGVLDMAQNTLQAGKAAASAGNQRNQALNALMTYAAGADLIEQSKAVSQAAERNGVMGRDGQPGAAAASGIKVSVSVGSSQSQSHSLSNSDTAAASMLKAGGDIRLNATQADLTVQGSSVQAAQVLALKAAQAINLTASASNESNRSSNSSSAASLGVSVGIGEGSAGLSADVAASRGRGQANADSTTYTNSHISAGQQLTLNSGSDTTVRGATVSAPQVVANVGRNLNVESLQEALLHKSINGQATPIPRRTQPMRIVCGVPSAVKRFRIAAQI